MKLTLLLGALLLSAQGWCSSGPVYYTTRSVSTGNHGVNNALFVCGCIFYMVSILWWTRSAKRRLDKTLNELIESMTEIDIYNDLAASGTSSRL